MRLLSRSWNLGNIMVVAGVLVLGLSFWVPYATASRVAKAEAHAARVATGLLTAAREFDLGEAPNEDVAAALLAALRPDELAIDLGVVDPATHAEAPPGLYFEGVHYYYLVRRLHPDHDRAHNPIDDERPIEVYAWPRSFLSLGQTAFYYPEDGVAAFTRNLQAAYNGFDHVPGPGCARRRDADSKPGEPYRGWDDERWIEHRRDDSG